MDLFIFNRIFYQGLFKPKNLDIGSTDVNIKWNKFWRDHGDQIFQSSWIRLHEKNIHKQRENLKSLRDGHYQHVYKKNFNLFRENFNTAADNFILTPEFRPVRRSFSEDDRKNCRTLCPPSAFGAHKCHKRKCTNLMAESFKELKKEAEINKNNSDMNKMQTARVVPPIEGNESVQFHKRDNRYSSKMPSYIIKDKSLIKYWRNRYKLFSRFDEGIKLDKESWFSVTPENIAKNIAYRMAHCDIVIDGFCGSGGNTIQLAMICKKVIAIDIDPIKIEMAKHNAKIYNVDQNIEFIVGDFFQLCERLTGDAVMVSPPWGGPNYKKRRVYDIEKCLEPLPATQLMESCRKISDNISLFLPRNSDKKKIIKLAGTENYVQIEQNYVGNKLVALTCYYGNLININF